MSGHGISLPFFLFDIPDEAERRSGIQDLIYALHFFSGCPTKGGQACQARYAVTIFRFDIPAQTEIQLLNLNDLFFLDAVSEHGMSLYSICVISAR